MNAEMRRHRGRNNIGAGIVIIAIGFLWLLRRMDFFIPDWVVSWQMLLIGIGFVTGINSGFRRPFSWILIFIGAFFLVNEFFVYLAVGQFFWPIAVMVIGLLILIKPKNPHCRNAEWKRHHYRGHEGWQWDPEKRWHWDPEKKNEPGSRSSFTEKGNAIDSVAIFNSVKKTILSKDFKGGETVTVFGGTELNMLQADFDGTIVLDVVVVFGGMKLFVPPNWDVQVNTTTILGGIEDKRLSSVEVVPDAKTLVITGTVLFGGIDIVSY